MSNVLWRILYALVAFGLFYWIAPLVLAVFEIPVQGSAWQLTKAVVGALCLCYIIWGPTPSKPWA